MKTGVWLFDHFYSYPLNWILYGLDVVGSWFGIG